jgi:hypothetical protein
MPASSSAGMMNKSLRGRGPESSRNAIYGFRGNEEEGKKEPPIKIGGF